MPQLEDALSIDSGTAATGLLYEELERRHPVSGSSRQFASTGQ
jgi:hypothetical protein